MTAAPPNPYTNPDFLAFLRTITANPDDDAPRLAAAYWLETHGDPERGQFIRIQCDKEKLLRQERILLEKNGIRWLGEAFGEHAERGLVLAGMEQNCINPFHRGFPQIARFTLRQFMQHGKEMFSNNPIQHLLLDTNDPEDQPPVISRKRKGATTPSYRGPGPDQLAANIARDLNSNPLYHHLASLQVNIGVGTPKRTFMNTLRALHYDRDTDTFLDQHAPPQNSWERGANQPSHFQRINPNPYFTDRAELPSSWFRPPLARDR